MEILLDFVYTETVHVTVENVQELLPAACLLQLKGEAASNLYGKILCLSSMTSQIFCVWFVFNLLITRDI